MAVNSQFMTTWRGTASGAEKALIICLALFSVLALTLRGWSNACLLLTFFLALYLLFGDQKRQSYFICGTDSRMWTYALAVAFVAPLIAIFLGQLFRHQLHWPSYDSPSKFLLALPVAWIIARHRINAMKLAVHAIPVGVFIAAISVAIHPDPKWGAERITTYFVDPLTFGSICLTFALISLCAIDLDGQDVRWVRIYKFAGFAIGLYLSFKSGSRTGWLALPIVLWLWLRYRRNIPHWLIFSVVTLACAAIYFSVPIVKMRMDAGIGELLHYRWNGMNGDTSVGMRISFLRIGWYLFSQNPLGGWGDHGFKPLLDAPELQRFASAFTSNFTFNAGFHNEIVTNMVRSGIWGLLSSLALFIIPMGFFIKNMQSSSSILRNHALVAVSYLTCVIISGMSTEVFNLKYTASFHAMMIATFAGTLLASMSPEESRENP